MAQTPIPGPDTQVPGARCERCSKSIDLNWTFCPFCGDDNRAPERRHDAIAPHKHDFRFGPHCMLCGIAAADYIQPSSQAIVYSSNLLNKLAGTAVLGVGLWLLYAMFLPASSAFTPSAKILTTTVVLLCGLGCFFTVRTTIVDPANRMVIWRRGIWPVVLSRSQLFDGFVMVRIATVWHYSRYGDYPTYRALLYLSQGSPVYLFEVRDPMYAFESANGVALTMGIPLDNEEQMLPMRRSWLGF